jgi:hypothetical protein
VLLRITTNAKDDQNPDRHVGKSQQNECAMNGLSLICGYRPRSCNFFYSIGTFQPVTEIAVLQTPRRNLLLFVAVRT